MTHSALKHFITAALSLSLLTGCSNNGQNKEHRKADISAVEKDGHYLVITPEGIFGEAATLENAAAIPTDRREEMVLIPNAQKTRGLVELFHHGKYGIEHHPATESGHPVFTDSIPIYKMQQ